MPSTRKTSQIPFPDSVAELVRRFEEHSGAYLRLDYNEAQVRQEFVNPMFKALGWDVDNEKGFAEPWKEVVHEAALKVGGATKAPDYSFRLGGRRMFFLEAKKPSVSVKGDPSPAYQLRRYAWTAKMQLSVLTNFAEFAVFDARVRPAAGDKASKARTLYLRCEEYAERWGEIASLLSPEAIQRGAFEKYAAPSSRKRGTAEVDDAFLAEIEEWRTTLARNVALRNPGLGQRDLNFAVQRTIDRIVFLRICEDRGVEKYGQLQALLNGPRTYPKLLQLFARADDRYNSGLFHFREEKGRAEPPDVLTPAVEIDDKPLKDILRRLYYPESPYEFSAMPAEILGQVYERFLGSVIRLTAGHRAAVEVKPEVRKAGGVYYTPSRIVDYVVEHTVGRLVEGKTPQEVAGATPAWRPAKGKRPLAVLDPACGSGSFLLGAYQFLLDWHLDQYAQDPQKWAKAKQARVFKDQRGAWRLTTAERKRILMANVFGVDIDPQAVEVTKLSLLLKVLEGENAETLDAQLKLFRDRALPDLAQNVKCGNSLVAPDFYRNRQQDIFDEERRWRINAFDWRAEFPAVMEGGGFDAVIGNPPWGQKAITDDESIKAYVRNRFPSTKGIYDLFRAFVEQGVRLAKPGGAYGMVLPDIVLLKNYEETRRFLLENLSLTEIDWWGMAFAEAVIDASTVIGKKAPPAPGHNIRTTVRDGGDPSSQEIPQSDFWQNPRLTFNLFMTPEKRSLVGQLEKCPRLADFFEVHEGVHSGNIRKDLFVPEKTDETCRPLFFGRGEILPYLLRWEGKYIRLSAMPAKKTRKRYANLGNREWHESPKVLVRRTGDYVLAAMDEDGLYASNNFFLVLPTKACSLTLAGLCALLNSELMTWYFRIIEPRQGRVFAELKIKHLNFLPLPQQVMEPDGCQELNELGEKRKKAAMEMEKARTPASSASVRRLVDWLNQEIHNTVLGMFGIDGCALSVESSDLEAKDGEEEEETEEMPDRREARMGNGRKAAAIATRP